MGHKQLGGALVGAQGLFVEHSGVYEINERACAGRQPQTGVLPANESLAAGGCHSSVPRMAISRATLWTQVDRT